MTRLRATAEALALVVWFVAYAARPRPPAPTFEQQLDRLRVQWEADRARMYADLTQAVYDRARRAQRRAVIVTFLAIAFGVLLIIGGRQ